MIDRVADTFVAGVELLEAEGRAVRKHAAAFTAGSALLVLAGSFAVLGVVATLVGVTWLIALSTGLPVALVIVGACASTLGACGCAVAWNRMNPASTRTDPGENGRAIQPRSRQ